MKCWLICEKMAVKSIYENKAILKDNLMTELKAYRNISIKATLLCFLISFVGHFAYTITNTTALNVRVDDLLYKSFQFGLVFGLIGYCLGAVVGAHLQRKRLDRISEERERRKRYLEEQVAIRQARLESI